jgi:hypothetical protein
MPTPDIRILQSLNSFEKTSLSVAAKIRIFIMQRYQRKGTIFAKKTNY